MTTSDSQPHFLWSDAWLFLAIAIAGRTRPAPLDSILAVADGIQHAIPTHAELNGAFGRLLGAGLIQMTEVGGALTEAGRTMHETAEASSRYLVEQQQAIGVLLGARSWVGHDPRGAQLGEADAVSGADVSRALDQYRRRASLPL